MAAPGSASGPIAPRFITEADYPWLTLLMSEYERFVGRRRRALRQRMAEPLGMRCDPAKLRAARSVLDAHWRTAVEAPVAPRQLRAELFRAACRHATTDGAMVETARAHGLGRAELVDALFADLPDEQRLQLPDEPISRVEVALRANLTLVQRLMAAASEVSIRARGGTRALVRAAQLRGLLCLVRGGRDSDAADLAISGPLALFHRTALYGRALASLVPCLCWCQDFTLSAVCHPREGLATDSRIVTVRAGDPIFPARQPRPFDSKLERRFARDFARAAPDWEIVREPEPLEAFGTLMFPDFELRHRRLPASRWFVEIVGFWTPSYLARKLAALQRVATDRFIVCIDEDRAVGERELPASAAIVRYRKRVDPREVLRIVEPHCCSLQGRRAQRRWRHVQNVAGADSNSSGALRPVRRRASSSIVREIATPQQPPRASRAVGPPGRSPDA